MAILPKSDKTIKLKVAAFLKSNLEIFLNPKFKKMKDIRHSTERQIIFKHFKETTI